MVEEVAPISGRLIADGQGGVVQFEHGVAEARASERKELDCIARGWLVADELVRRIDPEFRLRGAGRRASPQPGELLAHEVLAPGLARVRLPEALGLGQDERRVAAVILVNLPVDDLPGSLAERIEEPAVMRHDHDRELVLGLQVLSKPGDDLDIEVVCRLVEEQHVEVCDERPRELDAPALASGHIAHRAQEQSLVESAEQPGEHLSDAGIGRPLVHIEPRHDVVTDRLIGIDHLCLRHQPEVDVRSDGDPTRVNRLHASHDVQERALARPVSPDHRNALASVHAQRDAVQEGSLPECLGDLLDIHEISAGHG